MEFINVPRLGTSPGGGDSALSNRAVQDSAPRHTQAPTSESEPEPAASNRNRARERLEQQLGGRGIRLRVDETTRRIVAQILDANDQVIRQIPPEELLELAANVAELRGILFDADA